MRGIKLAAALLVAVLACVHGCGSSDGLQAVSGSVSYRGKPIENGTVTFLTTTGAPGPAGGALVTGGQFELPAARGLAPGTYRVAISAPEPGGELTREEKAAGASPKARETLPAKYNTATELKAEVRAGAENRFEFKLD
jgi:hypothetical protein